LALDIASDSIGVVIGAPERNAGHRNPDGKKPE
jgi:hypothetical protein